MLSICVGPNGSGKSLWAVHQVEELLLKDHRLIVTSLSLDIPRLNEYMQEKHPGKCPDVISRILLIGKEEMKTFWRFRRFKHDDYYGRIADPRGPFGDKTWSDPDPGVVFILDEVQTVFGARDWAKTGPEFVTYQSQHRKLGDDVIAISPSSSLIEKQFRILCGECVVLQNFYKLKFGSFKAPRKIVYSIYQNCPPLPGEDVMSKGNIYINAAKLAGCYRTQDGVGICGGGNADKGKESKGVPWYMVIPAIFLGFFLLYVFMSTVLGKGSVWAANKMKIPVSDSVPAAVAAVSPPPMGGFGMYGDTKPKVEVKMEVKEEVKEVLPEIVGLMKRQDRAGGTIVWDDGLISTHDQVQEDGRHVVVDGKRYTWRKKVVQSKGG